MKKYLKKIVGALSLVLIIGGLIVFIWNYFHNLSLFRVLMENSVVRGSLTALKIMALSILAFIAGLIVAVIYLKIGSSIRKEEKIKKKKIEEENNKQEENKQD